MEKVSLWKKISVTSGSFLVGLLIPQGLGNLLSKSKNQKIEKIGFYLEDSPISLISAFIFAFAGFKSASKQVKKIQDETDFKNKNSVLAPELLDSKAAKTNWRSTVTESKQQNPESTISL